MGLRKYLIKIFQFWRNINLQIQEAEQTLSKINQKKSILRHNIITSEG
jgi:hypothetical protein